MKLSSVSNSKLSTYESCPLKFYFSYIRKLSPEKKPIALAVGEAVHAVLAFQYNLKKTGQLLTKVAAETVFEETLKKANAELGDSTLKDVSNQYSSLLDRIIANPLDIKPNLIEYFFEIKLKNSKGEEIDTPFKGIIDLTSEADEVIEHKTSTQRYTSETINKSFQHVGYYLAYLSLFNKKPSKIIYHILYKTEDRIDKFELEITEHQTELFFEWVKKNIAGIEAEDWTPRPGTMNCRFCDFKSLCLDSKA